MQNKKIQLAVMDVDGTMFDSPHNREPSAELIGAIRRVADSGVLIGLASGRNYGHIMSQMRFIGFNGPIIANNGAYVVLGDKPIWEVLLDTQVVDTVIRQSKQYRYMVEFSGRNVMYTFRPEGYRGPVFPKSGTDKYLEVLDGTEADFDRMRNDRISKITMIMDDRTKAEAVASFWTEGEPARKVSLSSSFWYCLELTSPGITKGAALRNVAALLEIPLQQVLAIGDGDNDTEMLEVAGISFAMANGSAAALRAGKFRAPHVREDGTRQVLERYILNEESLP